MVMTESIDGLALRLDFDWAEFEDQVRDNEDHENPDILWPNGLHWKAQLLSEAWRVLGPAKDYKQLFEAGDLGFPIANMLMVGYIQYPNSPQRVEIYRLYDLMCYMMNVPNDGDYKFFSDMLDASPHQGPKYQEWIDWAKARCDIYWKDPHRGQIPV